MTNYRTRKLTNLHQVVDGVAAKDTTAKSIPPWRVQTTMGGWTAQLGLNDRNTRLRLDTGTAVIAIGAHTSWLKIYKALEIFKSQSSAYFTLRKTLIHQRSNRIEIDVPTGSHLTDNCTNYLVLWPHPSPQS